jgi:hypothetical protein
MAAEPAVWVLRLPGAGLEMGLVVMEEVRFDMCKRPSLLPTGSAWLTLGLAQEKE